MSKRVLLLASLLIFIPILAFAYGFADIEERVVEHQLDNGMRFLILERHEAPLVSMVLTVKAGSVNEVTNKTGLAHFLEHLAFKGTATVGTTNYGKEQKILNELDIAFEAYHKAEKAETDSTYVAELYNRFKEIQAEASSYVVQGEFSNIYERNGGTRLNASTSDDFTRYYVTLPSNRFELWCAMESDRLIHPVFRELYKERDVILEERRMSYDNNPRGLFYEEFNSVAHKAHPYGQPTIGHFSDMANLSREDVRGFYETYYVPQNITAAIVGDVDAEEIIPMLDEYFSRITKKPDSPQLITQEPYQPGMRRISMKMGKRPMLYMKFNTVSEGHPDEVTLDLLANIIGGGQISRLYRKLVEEEKLATSINAYHGTQLYAGSITFSASPTKGTSLEELEQAILTELKDLSQNPIKQNELDAALARWEVGYYDYISSNFYMAYLLATSDRGNSGWRYFFTSIEQARTILPQDVMHVASTYIDPDKRTVGFLEVEND